MSPPAIAIDGLTKRFGSVTAVDNLSFTVESGRVTGFLGPNGSGKTTTLRMLLGLVEPTEGTALISGQPYTSIRHPAQSVGAALEASSFHPGRTAIGHLRVLAPQVGVSDARCREVLDFVGLSEAADRRIGGFSMGMRQRLGLATALLGNPEIVVLDEPANGLDPQGIVWLRHLLRSIAAEGRTVLVSSHVLGEVRHTVDDVVVISAGRLIHASSLREFESMAERGVGVRTPAGGAFVRLATAQGWRIAPGADPATLPPGIDDIYVADVAPAQVGAAAFAAGIELHELSERGADLETVFLRLTTPTGQGVLG